MSKYAFLLTITLLLASDALHAAQGGKVTTLRVPDGGIQPQVAVDEKGIVHMIYYKGEPANGDIFYVKSTDGQKFSIPIQVNSISGSVIAMGNIRGAHIALGKGGRVHVAWMGSGKAPKGANGASPMLYTRSNDGGTAFEPERNVMQYATGLDGGGTVAADGAGNVYVAWHADAGAKSEAARQVFLAKSTDDGKTFAKEIPAFKQMTGACGCCGMRAICNSKGELYILYRTAMGAGKMPDERDMFLLVSKDKGATFTGTDLHPWKLNMCAMSTAQLSDSSAGTLGTWETQGQIFYTKITNGIPSAPISAPGGLGKRKHPAVAGNNTGDVLLAWTNGMAWEKGGSVSWQVFDKSGKPSEEKGNAEGVPANSLVAAFARPDGTFIVVY